MKKTSNRIGQAAPRKAAFTLVEIMVVVVIIGLLAAIALPAFQRVRRQSLATRYANDFRQIAEAFLRFSLENGTWPAGTTLEGEKPSDMPDGYLPARYFETTPMGGGYTWSGSSGRIRLRSTQATDEVMQKVDAILDDGDLSTGKFSRILTGGYHYQLN